MNVNLNPPKPLTKRNINRRIPISNKLKAILYAKEHGNHKASKKFNVDRKTIRYWRNQEQALQNAKNKNIRITLKHSGELRGAKKQKISSTNEIINQISFGIFHHSTYCNSNSKRREHNMKKKIFASVLAAAMVLSLCACSQKNDVVAKDDIVTEAGEFKIGNIDAFNSFLYVKWSDKCVAIFASFK